MLMEKAFTRLNDDGERDRIDKQVPRHESSCQGNTKEHVRGNAQDL